MIRQILRCGDLPMAIGLSNILEEELG